MNIHEHQAKDLLKNYGATVSNGIVILSKDEISKKIRVLKSKKFVVKAQIHAGGRGKAGGVKLVTDPSKLEQEIINMFGKKLVTHQTGPEGKIVKRVYVEEASDIFKEYYLSCLVDRASSKIAFISSIEGGVDIERVAEENPKKIVTNKFTLKENLDHKDIKNILKPFNLTEEQFADGKKIINSIYQIILQKDALLVEINPLIITKTGKMLCLDAKINFDANALFRRPEILKLRDLNEEDPAEIEASKNDLAYIKLKWSDWLHG